MKGINKAIIVGTLGQDPETRYISSGAVVTNISVATSETWKDKATGKQQEKTEWHKVTFLGKLAEIAGEYLKKGSQVYVEGRIQTDKWQDQQGNDRYTTKIIGNQMQMLGGKKEPQQSQGFRDTPPASTPVQQEDFEDNDIPF